MGYILTEEGFQDALEELRKEYRILAPARKKGAGRFTDVDAVIYDEVEEGSSIELEEKSDYSAKEVLTPLPETLFFFTEEQCKEADIDMRPVFLFFRSCDLQAMKRLDDMYLHNGREQDWFYQRRREKFHYVLIGCGHSYENCFCVDTGVNIIRDGYAFSVDKIDENYHINVLEEAVHSAFATSSERQEGVVPRHVTEDGVHVTVPETTPIEIVKHPLWNEYNTRCIGCGRYNYTCPTCSCYTMQDVYYADNGKVGEHRRVGSSCMVDGYTNVADGGQYRKTQSERMRFKTLHKIRDFRKRFDYDMCVGYGRCDDTYGEYVSFSNIIDKATAAVEEMERRAARMRNPYTPYPSKILEVIRHTEREFIFRMEYKSEEEVKPRQFLEVSVPKYGEASILVSGIGEDFVDLTIRKVSRVTNEVLENYEGDTLLLRGPYGSGFDTELCRDGETVVVAGGTGVSPVHGMIKTLSGFENAKQKYVIAGFRSLADMLFRGDLADWKDKLNLILVVDGTPEGYEGNIGLVTKYIADLPLVDPAKAKAVVVGPPPMMKFTVIELLKKDFKEENITASYERKMRCSLGKRRHCRVSGTYICLDGPVFDYAEAKKVID